MRLRGSMPSVPNSPHQNWCVDHRFRTRGTPTLSFARDGRGSAEGVLANHLGNVRVVTLGLLQLALHDAHLADVLDEALRTRVAADHALEPRGERQLAPRASGGAAELDVDERPRAVDRAPLAHGRRARRARVGERLDRVEATELRGRAPLVGVDRA